MSEDTAAVALPPAKVIRHGYPKSGVVVYTVRCRTRKDLNRYVANLPGLKKFNDGEIPSAYSISTIEPAFGSVIEEAVNGMVLSSHIIVVGSDGGEVTPEQEGRSWDHEIGHITYFFGSWGFSHLCATVGVRTEYTLSDCSEAAAYMAEYANACVNRDFFDGPPVQSGLPFILPWMGETDEG